MQSTLAVRKPLNCTEIRGERRASKILIPWQLSALPDTRWSNNRRNVLCSLLVCTLIFICFPAASLAAEPVPQLKSATREAFEKYVRLTNQRNDAELQRGTDLLLVDSLNNPQRSEAYDLLRSGQIKLEKLRTTENGKVIPCPSGLIHHWVGLVFIPSVKLGDVLAMLEDYDHHSIYFAPDVERSRILSHDDDHFRVLLRFHRHKVITVVLNTEHDVRYFRDFPDRAHSRSSATRIAEVENAGKSDEREKPPGDDGGYLWGMETWWRFLERDGGVYVQSEVASLTRDIPAGLGWLVGPFVNSIPRETLTATLNATRKAVLARRAAPAGSR